EDAPLDVVPLQVDWDGLAGKNGVENGSGQKHVVRLLGAVDAAKLAGERLHVDVQRDAALLKVLARSYQLRGQLSPHARLAHADGPANDGMLELGPFRRGKRAAEGHEHVE